MWVSFRIGSVGLMAFNGGKGLLTSVSLNGLDALVACANRAATIVRKAVVNAIRAHRGSGVKLAPGDAGANDLTIVHALVAQAEREAISRRKEAPALVTDDRLQRM